MFDLQINGLTIPQIGLHCDFWAAPSDEAIDKLCDYLYSEGVTGFYATLITAPYTEIERNLGRIAEYLSSASLLAKRSNSPMGEVASAASLPRNDLLSGVHIEGGYISREGIHPREYLHEFKLDKVKQLTEKYPGLIKLWTLCPKVDSDGSVTEYLQTQNIKVAYGHSNVSYNEAEKAFDKFGVDLVTHWPNAMVVVNDPKNPSRFNHRNPSSEYLDFLTMDKNKSMEWARTQGLELGLGFSAYHRENINVTVICGSVEDYDLHMSAEIFKLIHAKKKDKLILVSDSVAYSQEELKAGHPLALRGGRASLKKHKSNSLDIIGLS